MPLTADTKIAWIALLLSMASLALLAIATWINLSYQDTLHSMENQLNQLQSALKSAESMQPELIQLRQQMESTQVKLRSLEQQVLTNANKSAPPISSSTPIITPSSPIQSPALLSSSSKATPPASPHWIVVISSFDSAKKASLAQQSQRLQHLNTSVTTATVRHRTWYRIVKSGFQEKRKALLFANQLKEQGFKDAWVQYQP